MYTEWSKAKTSGLLVTSLDYSCVLMSAISVLFGVVSWFSSVLTVCSHVAS
jgi:hypothetical protein